MNRPAYPSTVATHDALAAGAARWPDQGDLPLGAAVRAALLESA